MEVIAYFGSYNVTRHEPKVEDHYWRVFARFDHVAIIVTAYFLMITIGPKVMKKRKPFDLRVLLKVYNTFQVAFNIGLVTMTFELWGCGIFKIWDHICEPLQGTIGFDSEVRYKVFRIIFYYYLTKILDLLDTVFFILRKKQSQTTFLHLFHHSWMVVSTWLTLVYLRDQMAFFFGFLNSVVHVFMYTYYFLSSLGPCMGRYLWWKRHLTKIQIVQFITILVILAKMNAVGCKSDPLFYVLWGFNITSFFMLFINFYIKSYLAKRKTE